MKPLGYGKLLDRCFHLYRRYAVKLLLLSLILQAPLLLIRAIIVPYADNTSIWHQFEQTEERLSAGTSALQDMPVAASATLGLLLVLYLLAIGPIMFSIAVRFVGAANQGEEISLSALLKSGFVRMLPLTGSTLLYGLTMLGIMFGVIIAAMAAVGIVVIIVGLGMGVGLGFDWMTGDGLSGNPAVLVPIIIVGILLYVALITAVSALFGYFAIRWGFYIPFVAAKEAAVGISYSWRLTRGSFWRLFFAYFTLTTILSSFMLLAMLIPIAVLQIAVQGLLQIILYPLYGIAYGVAFHDLRLRRGGRIEQMLEQAERKETSLTDAAAAPDIQVGLDPLT